MNAIKTVQVGKNRSTTGNVTFASVEATKKLRCMSGDVKTNSGGKVIIIGDK